MISSRTFVNCLTLLLVIQFAVFLSRGMWNHRDVAVDRDVASDVDDAAVEMPIGVGALGPFLVACGVDARIASVAAEEHFRSSPSSRGLDFIFATAHECGIELEFAEIDKSKLQSGEFRPGHLFIGITGPGSEYLLFRAPAASEAHVLVVEDGDSPQWIPREEFSITFTRALTLPTGCLRPVLWLPGSVVDVGKIVGLDPVPWNVRVVNPSAMRLEIVNARTTCGCLGVDQYPKTIEPFSFGLLKCRLLPAKSALKTRFNQSVELVVDGGGTFKFPVTGVLEKRIEVNPAVYDLGNIPPEETQHQYNVDFFTRDPDRTVIEPLSVDRGMLIGRSVTGDGKLTLPVTVDCAEIGDTAFRGFKLGGMFRVKYPGNDASLQEETTMLVVEGRRLPWVEIYPSAVFGQNVVPGRSVTSKHKFIARGGYDCSVVVEDRSMVSADLDAKMNTLTITATLPEGETAYRSNVYFRNGNRSITIPILIRQ